MESEERESGLLSYSNFMSISGIVPAQTASGFSYQPEGSPPTFALQVSPKTSFVAVSTYPVLNDKGRELSEVEYARLVGRIREELLAVQTAAANLLVAKLELFQRQAGVVMSNKLGDLDKTCKAQEATYRDAVSEYESTLANSPNVVVTRWHTATSGSASLGAGELASASASASREQNGIAIIAGLRTQTLWVGEDYLKCARGDLIDNDSHDEEDSPALLTREGFQQGALTTFLVQARCVGYVAERNTNAEILTKVNAEIDSIRNLKSAMALQARFQIEAIAKDLARLGTAGIVVSHSRSTYDVDLACPTGHADLIKTALNSGDRQSWVDVLAVRARPNMASSLWLPGKKTEIWKHLLGI